MKAHVDYKKAMNFLLYTEMVKMVKEVMKEYEGKTYCVSTRLKVGGKTKDKDWIGIINNGELVFKEPVMENGLEGYEIIAVSVR